MRYSGAGLGLSIVAGIVSAHQGTVTVENVDGGCRFSLLLPARDPPARSQLAAMALLPGASCGGAAARQLPREHDDRIPRDAVEEKLRAGRAQ